MARPVPSVGLQCTVCVRVAACEVCMVSDETREHGRKFRCQKNSLVATAKGSPGATWGCK